MSQKSKLKLPHLGSLGPGLLFAATSVGTSHLVQSTRAGALYGLSLVGIVVAANAIKYPAFRIASDYFPATGTSLLEAYRRQGRWALAAYFLITMSTLLFAVSALALMSAGLVKVIVPLPITTEWLALGLIVATAALIVIGHYKALENAIKVLIIMMVVCTLIATATVLPEVRWQSALAVTPANVDVATLVFIAALVGWMPVPLDVSIWQSLWAKAKYQDSRKKPDAADCRFDFNLGFMSTLFLALCFLCLGAGLMHSEGITPLSGSTAFSAQLISLYQSVFGSGLGPLVGIAALAVIYSSLLAVMDGFPRALASLHRRWQGIPEAQDDYCLTETSPFYLWVLAIMTLGAAVTYLFFLTSLTGLIDLAATVAFVAAPLIAYLNHKAITAPDVPVQQRPSPSFRAYSRLSIAVMVGFAVGYLFLRFWVS